MGESIGTGTATIELEDLEKADCFFLIGGNPSSNHPRLMSALMRLRRRGGKVIVINPAREPGLVKFSVPSDVRSLLFGSSIASLYLQPHIGGDIALMTGIAKALIAGDSIDRDFIAGHTEQFSALEELVKGTSWDSIVEHSGVGESEIREVAAVYAKSRNTIFGWTMGITHHLHGVDNVQWIINLALLRGMIGRPGSGLLPIRGHSNVQGLGTIGVTPQLKKSIYDRFIAHGFPVPKHTGFDTMQCIDAAHQAQMRLAVCLGGNLFGSNPDPVYAAKALANLDQIVYLSTHLNTGHAQGMAKETLILPVRARDEESQSTTQESMFNYVRYSDGGEARVAGARSEVEVIASLGRSLFPEKKTIDWVELEQHKNIRTLISRLVPDLISFAETEAGQHEFVIPGRVGNGRSFSTPSGRAQFAAHAIPAVDIDRTRFLNLMTMRSEGQFNTVVFEEEDVFRKIDRRDVILMNDHDIRRLGLRPDQKVTVRSKSGEMRGIRIREFDVKSGNVMMYCPEANVLLSRAVDPRSRTPAFKNEPIEILAH